MKKKKSWRAGRMTDAHRELSFCSDDVEKFWSDVALSAYEKANRSFGDTHTQRFDISIPRLTCPPHGRILNLWSRQGEALPYLRARFPLAEVVNAEISRVMLAQTRSRYPAERFVACDLQKIDFPDQYFDAVLSLEMLEHSPCPQKIIQEMFRVLRPGGRLILTCPSFVSEFHLWVADRFMGNHGEGPHRFPSIRRVKRMLKNAGFQMLFHKSTLFVPFNNPYLKPVNRACEKIFQFFPLNEFGIRQIYEALKGECAET